MCVLFVVVVYFFEINFLLFDLNELSCTFLLLRAKSILSDTCPQKKKLIRKYFDWPPSLLWVYQNQLWKNSQLFDVKAIS